MLVTTVVVAIATFAFKGAGSLAPRLPEALVRRTADLAPALLAALVVTEVVGRDGVSIDPKLAGVLTAVVLAWRRAPLAICVIGGAAVAAALRALT